MATQPIFNPDRGFSVWLISQIYTGPTGSGQIVPNVDDAVVSWTNGWYRVVAVNSTTLESTLDLVDFNKLNGGILAEDVLLSSGPNTYSESFRIHVNNNANPIRVAFDGRLYMNTDTADHVKLFRGHDIGPTGHVISAMFNPSNVLLSEDIPLAYRVLPNVTNVGQKSPVEAWLIEPLNQGEIVTAVFYNAVGDKISAYRLIADLGDYVHSLDTGKQYVIGISLLSNYLSTTDTHLIELPINMTLSSLGFLGRVHYNDGSHLDLPVDGNRFSLLGVQGYLPSNLGSQGDLVLKYKLLPTEYGYGLTGIGSERFLTDRYKVTAISRHAAYNVKLFVLPVWNTGGGGWLLKYYLYNLERNQVVDVTSYVETVSSSGTFNGGLYNTTQAITVALNLADADPSYDIYRYTQSFTISLRASGSNAAVDTYWILSYQQNIFVGSGLSARMSVQPGFPGEYRLNISQNLTGVSDWLNVVYWPTKPLYLPGIETNAPTPTHVRVIIDTGFVRELTVDEALLFIEHITLTLVTGLTLRLEFFNRTLTTDQELGSVTMNIK